MQKKQLAWILFPVVIVLIAVVTVVLSNFQKETGIALPGKSGVATVAALAEAERAASGSGAAGWWYDPSSGSFSPNDAAHAGM